MDLVVPRKRMFMIATVITATLLLFVPKVIGYLGDDCNRTTLRFTHALFISCLIKLVQYFVDLHYVFKSGHTSIKYFKIYEQIDDVLGMMYNSVIKYKVLTETVTVCSLVIVTLVVNFVTWSTIAGYAVHAVHSIDYILIFINTLTVIEICSNVIQVEYRLKTIGDILQDFYSSAYSLPVANLVLDKNWLYYSKDKSSERRHIDQSKFLETNHFNDLIWLNKCYMLLIRQTEYINETFGARILIYNFNQLFHIVTFTNLAIRFFMGVMFSEYPTILYGLGATCMLFTISSSVNIFWLVYRCQQSYEQRTTIISIADHILVETNISEPMRRTLTVFRNLVFSRPIQFSAMKFYPLTYSLMVSFASVVTTFTIIMLQNLK
ncbi:hypothetical protein ABMA28_006532 [Loxostege sticticalis]|uniref:Gustatory receptor n=1 Tax=Loxostege sticticalis TaxID=481309 RepID=A0ABD0SNP9_LOXSC